MLSFCNLSGQDFILNPKTYQRHSELTWQFGNTSVEYFRIRKSEDGVLFHQRPLRSQKHLVGNCSFEPTKTKCPISAIPNEKRRAWEWVNTVEYNGKKISQEEKEKMIEILYSIPLGKEKVDFKNIKKHKAPVYITKITQEEIDEWLKEKGLNANDVKNIDIKKLLGVIGGASEKLEKGTEKNIPIEDTTTSSTTVIEFKNNSTNLAIVSPKEKSFVPQNGLSFAVAVRNPESLMVDGRNVDVWCRWTFYLDDTLYTEKINPSTIHTDTKNVCEYSTLLIKQKGKLRVEFNLEKGKSSKYSDEVNIQTLDKTQREYIVQ